MSDTRGVGEPWEAHRRLQATMAWSAGQVIVNAIEAKVPTHRLEPPVPISARVLWDRDGEEWIETEALGWTGGEVYVRMSDPRYRLRAVWLDAADVRRRWPKVVAACTVTVS
jgi:hypothetical protein